MAARWILSSGLELPSPDVPIVIRQETIDTGGIGPLSLREAWPPPDVAQLALDTYRWARRNAVRLLEEARILTDAGRHARAFALAATSLEEIGKSQYAADVHTGFVSYEHFDRAIRDHTFKSAYQARGVELAAEVTPVLMDEAMGPTLFARRNESLYASPSGEIEDSDFEQDARVLIGYCEAWLRRIHRQESMAERIGTKAFLK